MTDKNKTTKVEMHLAYHWICEDCGRDNFCRGVTPQYDTQLEWDLKEHFGYGINDGGQFIMSPERVTCQHCGAKFGTIDPQNEADLEDGDDV